MTSATTSKTVKPTPAQVAMANIRQAAADKAAKAEARKTGAAHAKIAATAKAAREAEAKLKATVTEEPTEDTVHATHVEEPSLKERMDATLDSIYRNAMEYAEMLKLGQPKTGLLARVIGYISAFATGYAVGMVMQLLLAATTSMFLTVCIWVVGLVLAMYLGSKVGSAVTTFIDVGGPARVVEGAGRWVKGLFSSKPALA